MESSLKSTSTWSTTSGRSVSGMRFATKYFEHKVTCSRSKQSHKRFATCTKQASSCPHSHLLKSRHERKSGLTKRLAAICTLKHATSTKWQRSTRSEERRVGKEC